MGMSDEEPRDESTDESEQQAEEPPADSDQSTEQTEDQTAERDQSAEPSEGQPTETDQPSGQSEEQAADSDQAAEQSEDATGGGGGGGGSGEGVGGGGPADDAVAADSRQKRPLRVIAEFTQEGKKFIGDITLDVSEWDNVKREPGKSRFPDVPFLQDTAGPKANVIDTGPIPGGVPGAEVLIRGDARAPLPDEPDSSGAPTFQWCSRSFVVPMPAGTDVLPVNFDVEVGKIEPQTKTVDKKALAKLGPGGDEAAAAKAMVRQSPQLKGKFTFDLDATPLGNHNFRVTGKYLTGDIQSSTGRKFIPGL
jgi:hypothetical protein